MATDQLAIGENNEKVSNIFVYCVSINKFGTWYADIDGVLKIDLSLEFNTIIMMPFRLPFAKNNNFALLCHCLIQFFKSTPNSKME